MKWLKNKTKLFQTVNGKKVRPWRDILVPDNIEYNKEVFDELRLDKGSDLEQEIKKESRLNKKIGKGD